MKSVITFTTTISPNLMNWITKQSSKEKTTKRAILESAIKHYQQFIIKQELVNDFKRAAQDPEVINLAENGLRDYAEQLNNLEK